MHPLRPLFARPRPPANNTAGSGAGSAGSGGGGATAASPQPANNHTPIHLPRFISRGQQPRAPLVPPAAFTFAGQAGRLHNNNNSLLVLPSSASSSERENN